MEVGSEQDSETSLRGEEKLWQDYEEGSRKPKKNETGRCRECGAQLDVCKVESGCLLVCVCLVCSLLLCFSVCSVYRHQFPSSFIFTPSIFEGVSFPCVMVHRSGHSEGIMRCARHMGECAPVSQL